MHLLLMRCVWALLAMVQLSFSHTAPSGVDNANRVVPPYSVLGQNSPSTVNGRLIKPDDLNIRYMGHWGRSDPSKEAATVNSGSRIQFAFRGSSVQGLFGTKGITSPAHIYVLIDGGRPVFYKVDSGVIDFTPTKLKRKRHTLEIDIKDVDERVNRWRPPLAAALVFRGFMLDHGAKILTLPAAGKLKMEFYGDSITQGVALLSKTIGPDGSDGIKGYAFLTALAFNAVHNQIGFGRQGIIREGNGNVPPAPQAFGWNYEGSRADPSFVPDIVVVNQGTNDGQFPPERFRPAYKGYIAQIRRAYPKATIFCMRPFGGFHESDIKSGVESVADAKVIYVDTAGWLGPPDYTDGIHPSEEGHHKAAQKLVQVISAATGIRPVREVKTTTSP